VWRVLAIVSFSIETVITVVTASYQLIEVRTEFVQVEANEIEP
jgi:hypothetical protein